MDQQSGTVEVQIGGRIYRLRGGQPALLQELASRVDRALADVAGPEGAADDFKVAVLAALNLEAEREEDRAAWLARAQAIAHRSRELEDRLVRLAAALEPVDGGG
ncbi:MAG: cell division protein ZapA [Acidobacteria bacterium]|nr:cell division protein ZapA [Acidobacteriota bacterium]